MSMQSISKQILNTIAWTAVVAFGIVVAQTAYAQTSVGTVMLAANSSAKITLNEGQSFTLAWEVVDVTATCSIDNGIGAVDATGSRVITPPAADSTVYTLTCGEQTSSVNVVLRPVVTIDMIPNTVDVSSGSAAATLTWSSRYANQCTALTYVQSDGTSGSIAIPNQVSGSVPVTVGGETTYTLTCRNNVTGTVRAQQYQVNVTGVDLPDPRIIQFTATPNPEMVSAVDGIARINVRWTSEFATSCTRRAYGAGGDEVFVSSWTNSNPSFTNGNFYLYLDSSVSLELRCGRVSDNEFVTATQNIVINPNPAYIPSPSAEIIAANTAAITNNLTGWVALNVTPQTSNVDTCVYTATKPDGSSTSLDGWTNRSQTSGFNETYPVTLRESVTLNLSCTRAATSVVATDSLAITVTPAAPAPAPTVTLTSSANAVSKDGNGTGSVTLTWSATNSSFCYIREALATNGFLYEFSPRTDTTHTVTVPVYMDTTFVVSCGRSVDGETADATRVVTLTGGPANRPGADNQCFNMGTGQLSAIPANHQKDANGYCAPIRGVVTVEDALNKATFVPACPWTDGPNRRVFNFNKTVFSWASSKSENDWNCVPGSKCRYSLSQPANLPAGSYSVSMLTYDGYVNRIDPDISQPDEVARVNFMNNGTSLVTSGATLDLVDGVYFTSYVGTVNNSLFLPEGVNQIRAEHAYWCEGGANGTGPFPCESNSVRVACVALDSAPPTVVLEGRNESENPGGAFVRGQLIIEPGEQVTLSWKGDPASECVVVSGDGFTTGGAVEGTTGVTEPDAGSSSLYTVRCTNGLGTGSDTITVITNPGTDTPIDDEDAEIEDGGGGDDGDGEGGDGNGDGSGGDGNGGEIVPVGITLESDKRIVRQGETVNLFWNVDVPDGVVLDCRFNPVTVVGSPVVTTSTGVISSTPLSNERTYILDCGDYGQSNPITIRVLPQISET